MPTIYEKNFQLLLTVLSDLPDLKTADYRRLCAPNFMPLSVDVLLRRGQQLRIALAHNYEMNGDLVPDPDMELSVNLETETVKALTFQDAASYYEASYLSSGVETTSLNAFLHTWLQNLIAQGHTVTASQ